MDYLSRKPISPPQTDDAYEENYVINSILPYYNFISKYGCLSNHIIQSESRIKKSKHKVNNKPGQTPRVNKPPLIDSSEPNNSKCIKITMDAKTDDNSEASNPSAEATDLMIRWRKIAKPGIYRMETKGKMESLERTETLTQWKKNYRRKLTADHERPGARRSLTRKGPTAQRRLSTFNRTRRTVDSWSILGEGLTNFDPTGST